MNSGSFPGAYGQEKAIRNILRMEPEKSPLQEIWLTMRLSVLNLKSSKRTLQRYRTME